MNELALFAGCGGGILGGKLLEWRTVCAVEIDPYCRAVLEQRQNEGYLEPFPIWDDVRSFVGTAWRGKVDVVTGGFPCQPFSVAGQRRGEDDERNLWPETIRVIREVGPRFALLENVPGLLAHDYFGTILGDLAASGYRFRWRVLSAAEVGAPHKRDRVWILADSSSAGERRLPVRSRRPFQTTADIDGLSKDVADTDSQCGSRRRRLRGQPASSGEAMADAGGGRCATFADETGITAEGASQEREPAQGGAVDTGPRSRNGGWWSTDPADRFAESGVGRVADGISDRVGQLRALGNAQVPLCAAVAFRLLVEDESCGAGTTDSVCGEEQVTP